MATHKICGGLNGATWIFYLILSPKYIIKVTNLTLSWRLWRPIHNCTLDKLVEITPIIINCVNQCRYVVVDIHIWFGKIFVSTGDCSNWIGSSSIKTYEPSSNCDTLFKIILYLYAINLVHLNLFYGIIVQNARLFVRF